MGMKGEIKDEGAWQDRLKAYKAYIVLRREALIEGLNNQ